MKEYLLLLMVAGEPSLVAEFDNARACNDALIELIAPEDAPEYACRRSDGRSEAPEGPVRIVSGYDNQRVDPRIIIDFNLTTR